MDYPKELRYTKDHEWVRIKGHEAVVGITAHAQAELGEIVYVELPEVGRVVAKSDPLCVVESTKAAADVYAPVGGTVKERNAALRENPGLVNSSPYQEGWMAVLTDVHLEDLSSLMSHEEYQAFVGQGQDA